MPVFTRNDLVKRVLVRLGEVGFGQAAEPEAAARVREALAGILSELALDGVYDFADADEVPAPAMDPLAAIVASRLADEFSVPTEEATLLGVREQGAIARLRRYKAQPASTTWTQGHYF